MQMSAPTPEKHVYWLLTLRRLFGIRLAMLAIGVLFLTACASAPYYGIGFSASQDSPDIEVLNYQYGTLDKVFFAPEHERLRLGQTFRGGNLNGFLPRGEFLYVKWRIKATGEVLEDRVDLRNRLPENLEDLKIHFVCHGRQLYVFVRWPWDGQPRTREPSRDEFQPIPGGVKRYEGHKIQQIYPDPVQQ